MSFVPLKLTIKSCVLRQTVNTIVQLKSKEKKTFSSKDGKHYKFWQFREIELNYVIIQSAIVYGYSTSVLLGSSD